MSKERVVMILMGERTLVAKLKEDGSMGSVCLCTFVTVPMRDSVGQLAILRKIGNAPLGNFVSDYSMIDVDTDTDIYAEFIRLTSGIETATELPRGPRSFKSN